MPPPTTIHTIGYGSRTYEDFVAALRRVQAEYLVDVRSAPYSRFKPDFSRDALAHSLERDGIRYVFMGDSLGGRPDDPACYTGDGRVDYVACRRRRAFQDGISVLETGHESGATIVLMCSEGRPQECHRAKLVAAELVALRIPVVHVDEAGDVRTHDEVMGLVTGGQDALFDEPASATTSRRAHRVVS